MPARRQSSKSSRIPANLSEDSEARIKARHMTKPAWGVRAFLGKESVLQVMIPEGNTVACCYHWQPT